jgi:mannosyltransferase OCH1-like enzyme
VFVLKYINDSNKEGLDNVKIEEKKLEKGVIVEGKRIPKNIIQTWKSTTIPLKYEVLQKGLIEKNPDYEYLFFTDESINAFLKTEYPEYYITFQKLPILIQKIDFFRYIAVYHYGGFYFDLDMECLEPLGDDLLEYHNVIPVDDKFMQSKKDINREWINDKQNQQIILGQYAFGAVKQSQFMKFIIDNIHENIDIIVNEFDSKVKNNISNYEYFVYKSTGPDYVTKMYSNYFQKKEIFILDYKLRQYFGKYARHRYFGTWKNNTNN